MVGTEVFDVRFNAIDGDRIDKVSDFRVLCLNHWISMLKEMWGLCLDGKTPNQKQCDKQ